MTPRAAFPLAAASLLVPLAGCFDVEADDAWVGGPDWNIGTADFYHSYEADHEWWPDEFTWQNPDGKAALEVRHALRAGSQYVEIRDGKGAVVFANEWDAHAEGGQSWTGTGAPGAWTIVLERRAMEGQFDVHVWRIPAEA